MANYLDKTGVTKIFELIHGNYAPSDHEHAAGDITSGTFDSTRIPSLASSKITALTGYTIATALANIAATDSLNTALGKLQYKLNNHTHSYLSSTTKYAGSSSVGGAATSANKVNTDLTIKLNSGTTEGTNSFTFNGSTAKTIDITPSTIGAAPSDHEHAAGDITSGTLAAARIPSLASSKITALTGYTIATKSADIATSDSLNDALGKLQYKLNNHTHSYLTAQDHYKTTITAGSFGPSANATLSHSGTFTVPYVTVNENGHVSGIKNITYTLPASGNTDKKVDVTLGTTTKAYLLGTSTTPTTTATGTTAISDTGVYLGTTAGSLYATTLYENGTSLADKYQAKGDYLTAQDHYKTTITAGSFGPSANATLSHSGTFTVPYVTVNTNGHVSAIKNITYTLPASGNTDKKVDVTLGTTTKAYLLGTSTTPTSTAAAVTSIADTGVYLGTTAGSLYATTLYENGTSLADKYQAKGDYLTAQDHYKTTITAGSFGPSANATLSHSGTFTVPYVTVNTNGHVSAIKNITYTLPASGNTDKKVGFVEATINVDRPVLFANNSSNTAVPTTGSVYYKSGFTYNASANALNIPTGGAIKVGGTNVSLDGHTHDNYLPTTTKYAGSSLVGGAATSANKVNTNLTIKFNSGATEGENLFTFNGSTAKTINITPYAIGAIAEGISISDISANEVTLTSDQYALICTAQAWENGNTDGALGYNSGYYLSSTGLNATTLRATTIYENGSTLSSKYQPKGTYLTTQDHYKTTITAGSFGPSADAALSYSGTFTVPYVTVNANGHVSAIKNITYTLPASSDNDTKNTAGATNSTSQLFLIGAASQGNNPQTYSNANCYTLDGHLYSNKTKVSVEGHTHSGYAPTSHASTATTYGTATVNNYGHVKISNGDCNTTNSANGLAAGMSHTHGNYVEWDKDQRLIMSDICFGGSSMQIWSDIQGRDSSSATGDHNPGIQGATTSENVKTWSISSIGEAWFANSVRTYTMQYYQASNLSDINEKNIIVNDIPLTIKQIAEAPTVEFKWKYSPWTPNQIGTIAQYWQNIIPQAVTSYKKKDPISEQDKEVLALDYNAIGVVSSIKVARHSLELEEKVKSLQEENDTLKSKLASLESRLAEIEEIIESIL